MAFRDRQTHRQSRTLTTIDLLAEKCGDKQTDRQTDVSVVAISALACVTALVKTNKLSVFLCTPCIDVVDRDVSWR